MRDDLELYCSLLMYLEALTRSSGLELDTSSDKGSRAKISLSNLFFTIDDQLMKLNAAEVMHLRLKVVEYDWAVGSRTRGSHREDGIIPARVHEGPISCLTGSAPRTSSLFAPLSSISDDLSPTSPLSTR